MCRYTGVERTVAQEKKENLMLLKVSLFNTSVNY